MPKRNDKRDTAKAEYIKRRRSGEKVNLKDLAEKLGVTYGRITIRCQKSRWGSCSSRGDLSFNCTLMKCPPEALDSVVVHELCHRKEMNHSARFYAEVLRVFPDYPKWHRWLKETGSLYLPDGE